MSNTALSTETAPETATSDTPMIYVADLAAYNAGHLHGIWIEATDDLEDIQEQIQAMLEASPVRDSEEYSVHDYQGFGSFRPDEYESIESLHEVACFLEDYPDFGSALLNYYSDLHGEPAEGQPSDNRHAVRVGVAADRMIKEARKMAEDSYCGCYASVADYAQELTEETSEIPQHLASYIDYERMARDMEMSGDIITIETGFEEIHLFWA